MDEITGAADAQQETGVEKVKWYEGASLEDAKAIIKANITTAARSFIAIGYYLKHIRDKELYIEDGHDSIWEFAQEEYGISKSTASRYMTMNDRFSDGGNSPNIAESYQGFGKSQLQEMLSLNDEQLEQVTPDMTVLDIRDLARPEELKEEIQVPGQIAISEFPEYLPSDMLAEMNTWKPERVDGKKSFTMSLAEMLGGAGNIEEEETEIPIAASQRMEPEKSGICIHCPDLSCTLEDAQKRVAGTGDDCYGKCCWNCPKHGDCRLECNSSEHRPKTAPESMVLMEEDENVINEEFTEVEESNPNPKPEQPELPFLKNNDQRAAFVDNFETWPLWIETEETGERYYRYDLEDGTSMAVKVYHAMLFDGFVDGSYESRYREGYGRQEYYLLKPGKFFRDCELNRSGLIEKLKEIQKRILN